MPYYRHRSTDEPTAAPLGTYTSAQEAHQAKEPGESVTFVESDEERENWTERERERFNRGEYVPAPFYTLNTTSLHFVHLSRKHPGQIAFTKTTEHGVQDRQTIMRPGRYLEEFFKYEDGTPAYQDFWPTWIAQCSASAVTYAIATTADDIETVYRYGPRSCMSDEGGGPFRGQPHPTRVYGESDLSLAYMGPKEHATARALIWPEKKYYGRLYGNREVLRQLLEADGYQDAYEGDVTMAGARIRKITHRGKIVCPYIDAIDYVEDTSDGWLTLGGDDADIGCQQTDGYASDQDTDECAHCGDRADRGSAYCDSCENDRATCERCNDNHWDGGNYCDSCTSVMTSCDHCSEMVEDDDARHVEEPDVHLCESCYETHATECAVCTTTIAHSLMRRAARQQREANGTARLCDSCITAGYRACGDCDDHTTNDTCLCDDCTPEPEPEPEPEPCDGPTPDGLLFDLTPVTGPTTIRDERLF